MAYTNSSLVSYTNYSPNHSGRRTHSIDRITPHMVVGQCSVYTLGALFARESRQASSNYGIGFDGKVGLFVDEANRSWCSSSGANDQRAITIEVASDNYYPYAVNSVAYERLIELCADICKRNGKTKLLWLGDKNTTLNYSPKADEMILTCHCWFADTSCPGAYLLAREGDIAKRVTALLSREDTASTKSYLEYGDHNDEVAAVQKRLNELGYKLDADGYFGEKTLNAVKAFQTNNKLAVDGYVGEDTKKALSKDAIKADKTEENSPAYPQAPFLIKMKKAGYMYVDSASVTASVKGELKNGIEYTIIEVSGHYGKLKSGAGWVDITNSDYIEIIVATDFKPYIVKVAINTLNIRKGPGSNYSATGKFTGKGKFTIVEEKAGKGSTKGWGKLKSGAGWISLDHVTKE